MPASIRPWILKLLGDEPFERLANGLSGSELNSLLLEVLRRRAQARGPAALLSQHQSDRLCQPAATDLRQALAVDAALLAAAADFDALDLSPVAPLGACSSVALTDQHRVLSALRRVEVVSDPSNVLALECAARMRAGQEVAHLATSQRVIRTQPVPKVIGFTQHFRIFVLASGGRERADHALLRASMLLQIQALLAGLDRLERQGFHFGARRVEILSTAARAPVARQLAEALTQAPTSLGPLDHGYYSGGLRYRLWVTAPDGEQLPLGDGGAFDWLGRIAANHRATFVASGLGTGLIPLRFTA